MDIFFSSVSQRLSLWGHCLFLAVLSRITGNLNLIFALCGKYTYLERVGTPLLRCLHPKGLRVLYEVGHSFGGFCFVLGGFWVFSFWKLFSPHHFLSSERVRLKKNNNSNNKPEESFT